MKIFQVGELSKRAGFWFVFLLLLQFALLVLYFGNERLSDTSSGCVECHSDKKRMTKLGYPGFHMTVKEVRTESNHPNAACRDCHLGDGRADTPEEAHRGMLKAILVGEDSTVLDRYEITRGPLLPTGGERWPKLDSTPGEGGISSMLPKEQYEGELYIHEKVRNLLWHDRNRETYDFDPSIVQSTCAQEHCHPEALKQFRTSVMGTNYRQRTMQSWLRPYGPHNCGPSFADLKRRTEQTTCSFDYENTAMIADELNVPFTQEQARAKQRFCNVCHTGCLDCHYAPDRELGVHNFNRVPTARGCLGGGRGTSICHPGAMHSRRGETYLGGNFSLPFGMAPDVHATEKGGGLSCVECHPTKKEGMGAMSRTADCQSCHIETERALDNSVHKTLSCAACHVTELGGYQLTMWGPGPVAEAPSPVRKYSLYYGTQKPPVIMKDQKGKWMAAKVWPHSLANFKEPKPPDAEIKFRWPEGETRDAYYLVGTREINGEITGGKNNRYLLWLEMERAAHGYTKARSCESCHEPSTQIVNSSWTYMDYEGAESFTGAYIINANSEGLKVENLRADGELEVLKGAHIEDFAPWTFFPDAWSAPGDFSIPTERGKYLKEKKAYDNYKQLTVRIEDVRRFDKSEAKEYKILKEALAHNPQQASPRLGPFSAP